MTEGDLKLDGSGIKALVNGYKASRVLLTAVELKLFDHLGDSGATSQVVAEASGTDPRATDRLMNAMVSLGLLKKRNGRFSHTRASAAFLDSSSSQYMANLEHSVHLWDSWSTMTEVVRTGGPVERRFNRRNPSDRTVPFIAAMHHFGGEHAARTLAHVPVQGVGRILDVGGGSGAYSIAMLKANPSARAVVFDRSGVVQLTRKYAEAEGVSDRLETVEGDYHHGGFPEGFDLVFMSAIVHINSPDENRLLVERGAAVLNPGGLLVVRDFIVEEDRSGPLEGTIFALNMLVNTECGDTYTESEMRSWFEAAGLQQVERCDIDARTSLMMGKRV
jgi:ubiquinone/menaquinone biosynthesis C-methylase UbiE